MKIQDKILTDKDISRKVLYTPDYSKGDPEHLSAEIGYISSFRGKLLFIKYNKNKRGVLTNPTNLTWL